MPLTLQECHELLTMIHFIMGNNHERLTMIHLIKRVSLLNQQSVCNSLHHFLTFSQLTVLSIYVGSANMTLGLGWVYVYVGSAMLGLYVGPICWSMLDLLICPQMCSKASVGAIGFMLDVSHVGHIFLFFDFQGGVCLKGLNSGKADSRIFLNLVI